jgi:tetratricopeptide repeat protein 21B
MCRNLEGKSVKQAVLECYASMATRHKSDIENAIVRMQDLVGQDTMVREKERVSSMLAVATGLTMLRQAAKAKNQLRAIDRMPYKWDDGDDFERAWLMLANIHMQVFTSVGRVFDFVNNLQFWFFQKK